MLNNKKICIIVFILIAVLACDILFEVNFPKVNEVDIKSSKIKSEQEIRIVQISDLHNQKFFNNNKDLYQKIKAANPDFIAITGDFIDKSTSDYTYAYGVIDELLKINKNIYFVAGDHEQKNTRNILTGLVEKGVKVLNKSEVAFTKGGQSIYVYGLDYFNTNRDIDFIKNIPQNSFSILILHNPDLAISNNEVKEDLILSGDTHGGQIRLPIVGAIAVPGQPLFPKYSKGLYKLGNGSLLYIDSGLGNTLMPIRFLNRSQISLIIINPISGS
ncbi:MAG: metallophosphoesterase [Candidatus Paceibacterota bacterium]